MNKLTTTAEELLLEFLHQKKQLAKRAGIKHTDIPTWPRAVHVWGKHMETMAALVRDWEITPAIVMQAAFDQAMRNRHPDGPQINMLKSDKFLTNALSTYLNMPVALIRERRSQQLLMEIMDKEFEEVKWPDDLLSFTIEDVGFRYVKARDRKEDVTAVFLARDVLERITNDRRMDAWMTHRGYPFMDVAQHYNRISTELVSMPPLETEHHES